MCIGGDCIRHCLACAVVGKENFSVFYFGLNLCGNLGDQIKGNKQKMNTLPMRSDAYAKQKSQKTENIAF